MIYTIPFALVLGSEPTSSLAKARFANESLSMDVEVGGLLSSLTHHFHFNFLLRNTHMVLIIMIDVWMRYLCIIIISYFYCNIHIYDSRMMNESDES